MASYSDIQTNKPKREVTYFGPIYIAAYPKRHEPQESETSVVERKFSDKGTSTEPFDISKYKITKETGKTQADKPESPKRSPKRFLKDIKHGIEERLHRHHNHTNDVNLKAEKSEVLSGDKKDLKLSTGAEIHRSIGLKSFTNPRQHIHDSEARSKLHYNDNEDTKNLDVCMVNKNFIKFADSIEDTYETMVDTSFKISSTEDNYLKNKLISNEPQSDTGDIAYQESSKRIDLFEHADTSKFEPVIHSKQIDQDKNGTELGTRGHQGRERLFKHREMIAKLKRKFFESPPKSMNKLDVKSHKDTNPGFLKEADDLIQTSRAENLETTSSECENKERAKSINTKRSLKTHFATESRVSRLRNSGKSSQCRHRRHSLDGKLSQQEPEIDQVRDLKEQSSSQWTEYVAVVAIDFGTTQSGYAYSFLHDPGAIHTMRRHEGGEPGVFNQKIPTTILLAPDGSFHSFGYAAIDFYHDLDPRESAKWLFFDRFKMMLFHEKTLSKSCLLKSVSGKEVSAVKIFALSLEYFRNLVLQELSDQSGYRICYDVIRWVITVPAIWRASAKQFMREAAYEAGLVHPSRPDQLLIALEPEAASIYCRKLRLLQVLESPAPRGSEGQSHAEGHNQSRASTLSLPELNYTDSSHISNDLSAGTRYLVVDCGGGTVDITVHEILPYGRLKELHRASGGPYGSTGVDAEFEKLLCNIFGGDIISHFKKKRPSGWIELLSMFESRKRVAGPYRTSHISVSLPFSFIDFYKKCRGSSVDSAVKRFGDVNVTWTSNGMLKLSPGAMRRLFLPTIDGMKQAIGSVLNNPNTRGLSYMFLVGGFAESSMVQHEIRKDFGDLLKIIIPPGVGMTIVKGAVYFGLDPNVVSERRSCQTYGVGVLHRFDPQIHPQEKKISKDGIDWCTDIFDAFVHANQSVALGDKIIRRYTPVRRNQTTTTIHIYSTEKDHVMFISDNEVTRCGTLSLSLDETEESYGSRREIRAEMTFGDTEIKVCATDVTSGLSVEAYIDFINV